MSDHFTETSRQGFGSRLANSFAGLVIGPLLVIGAIVLLWWNEGRAVQAIVGLKDAASQVVEAHRRTDEVELAAVGDHTAAELIENKRKAEAILTWILRGVGTLVMFLGFAVFLTPLSTMAAVIPLLGGVVRGAVGLVALAIAVPLSILVIAFAWLAYRPILGIALILLAIAVGYGLWRWRKARAPAEAPAAPAQAG
jgi:hypothetical protein